MPAGTQKIQWAYTKNSGDEEEGILDTAWLDAISFTPVTKPDLLIKSLEVESGTYILDRLDDIDGDKVPIRVVAENRGTDIPATFTFGASDIELRLTADRVWGNDDDISLGQVAVVQQTQGDSGLQIVFEGDVLIPDFAAVGDYFVAAFIDFNDRIDEFEGADFIPFTPTDNNFAITSNRDVTVQRLPNLVVENFTVDNTKIHYPEGSVTISFDIRNRGLEATNGAAVFNQRITLFSIFENSTLLDDFAGQILNDPLRIDNFTAAAAVIDILSNFPENAFLPGIDEFNPQGGRIRVVAELILPTLAEIQDALPGDLPNTEFERYLFAIDIDSENAVPESDERNRFLPVFAIPIFFLPNGSEDFAAWAARNELNPVDPDLDPDGDGLTNLEEYAIDSSPQVADTNGNGILNSFGITLFENEKFLSLTFDLNIFADDLLYFVEVSSDMINFTPILTIEPPFLAPTGSGSLNGNAGLHSDTLVLSIAERGYTARITVRDNIPVDTDELDQRFMRLRVLED